MFLWKFYRTCFYKSGISLIYIVLIMVSVIILSAVWTFFSACQKHAGFPVGFIFLKLSSDFSFLKTVSNKWTAAILGLFSSTDTLHWTASESLHSAMGHRTVSQVQRKYQARELWAQASDGTAQAALRLLAHWGWLYRLCPPVFCGKVGHTVPIL